MKTILVYIVISILACVTAFAQSESRPTVDIPPAKQVLDFVPISEKMFVNDSLTITHDSSNRFDNNVLFTPRFINGATFLNYDFSKSYNYKRFTLMPYNQRMFHLGLGDINNLGGALIWKTNKRVSFAGSIFLSKQYGYMLSSKHISLGLGMEMNYQLNNQFALTFWGQYLLNRNNDFFIRSPQPKTGIGIRLEYNPTYNTKFSIDAGFQESAFDNSKLNYSVEGKASIKF